MKPQNVEFAAEGDVTLRGWLFVPDGSGPHPAITMAHGFAGVKEHGLERFARAFAAAGFVVLVHDHRGFGASDGSPRYDIDPWVQIADWRRAISFLESQPFVDLARIGLWGSSYAGGHAIVLGATDRRLRAVVAQVPTISGYQQSLRRAAPDQVPALEAAFADDERRQFCGAPPATQAVVSADPAVRAAYRAPEAIAFYHQPVPEGVWDNVVTLRSTRAARMYEPGTWISRVSPTPLLMIVGLHDTVTLTDLALGAYEAALQPKKLVTIDGGHFDPYLARFDQASAAAIAWFTEHLAIPENHRIRKEYTMSQLHYDVLVHDGLRRHREQRLPDGSPIISSPVSSTLIYGEHDAVLVDPPFTYEQVSRAGDWIERSGKHLKAVYATHGHGDHWFGTDLLLQRFPEAHAYATDGTIAMMHKQATAGRAQMWDVDFPGLIPPSPVVYRSIPADGIELEGHQLLAVEVGHTDTDDTTVLHVPSIGLVVAGDVAYNGVHQYLLESAHGGIEAWLAALDKVAALQPSTVVAGHKNKDLPDDPAIIDESREYLLTARRLLAETPSPREYFDQMVTLYPDRLNVGPVWYSAVALLSEPPSDSAVGDEVAQWFFDDYLTTWIGVGAGTIQRGPEFVLDYWSAPLHWSDDQVNRWFLDAPAVVGVLHQMHTRLRDAGYAHTAVPDRRVRVYHQDGAAIEVIWSRQRADGSEIERVAAHFEVARGPQGWRIVSIQAVPTTSDSLTTVWPQAF